MRKSQLEADWIEQETKVEELEEYEKDCAMEIVEKEILLQRIQLAGTAESGDLAKLAKKRSRVKKMDKGFKKCGNTCLLTPYEGNISFRECKQCRLTVHEVCQVEEEDDVDTSEDTEVSFPNQTPLTCRECACTNTFVEQQAAAKLQLHNWQIKLKKVSAALNEARILLASKKETVVKYMGAKEKRLEEILMDDLKVKRCEFASQAYVGKHASIILNNYEKVNITLENIFLYKFCS